MLNMFKTNFLAALFVIVGMVALPIGALADDGAHEQVAQEIQRPESRRRIPPMSVTIEPLKLALLTGSLKYSVGLADFVALTVPLQGTYFSSAFFPFIPSDQKVSLLELVGGVGARFFLSNSIGKSSWYIEPALKIGYWKGSVDLNVGSAAGVGKMAAGKTGRVADDLTEILLIPDLQIGYSWVIGGFTADLGVGVGYALPVDEDAKVAEVRTKMPTLVQSALGFGIRPSFAFAMGYAW